MTRYTLLAGRTIARNGTPVVSLHIIQNKVTGERNIDPVEADALARRIVALLESATVEG